MIEATQLPTNGCYGFCSKCNTIHTLGVGNTRVYAEQLMRQLVGSEDSMWMCLNAMPTRLFVSTVSSPAIGGICLVCSNVEMNKVKPPGLKPSHRFVVAFASLKGGYPQIFPKQITTR